MEKLNFKGNDPGAVKFGNFINYYSFHPPDNRMKHFPSHLWKCPASDDFLCLDIGCNSGDLTEEVFLRISQDMTGDSSTKTSQSKKTCVFLAIDIDPILIERAQEKNKYPQNILFECADFMDSGTDFRVQKFLTDNQKTQFDITFCFSVSMWIHLNHGDDGLRRFLRNVCENSKMIVIEPQPWKCYKSAVKRLKRQKVLVSNFEKLTWRETVDTDIEHFLKEMCNFTKVYETPESTWGRRIIFMQNDCLGKANYK